MNTTISKPRFKVNVAPTSENGHDLEGLGEVIEMENLPQNYIVRAEAGSEVTMKSKNHGTLKKDVKAGHSYCVVHQDDVDELAGVIRQRLD